MKRMPDLGRKMNDSGKENRACGIAPKTLMPATTEFQLVAKSVIFDYR